MQVEELILFNHQFDGLYGPCFPSEHELVELEQGDGRQLRSLDYD
jgi:hypothetical protein